MIPRGPFRAKTSLILASTSPRRQAMLAALGLSFFVRPPQVDESVPSGVDPAAHALALARAKALACAEPKAASLGADTVVAIHGEVLGKPRHHDEALAMLQRLAGKEHWVHTGVAIHYDGRIQERLVSARVVMAAFPESIFRAYAATGEGLDKAGAYAVQGIGGFLVQAIHGSASAVIGLPLTETVELLLEMDLVEVAP